MLNHKEAKDLIIEEVFSELGVAPKISFTDLELFTQSRQEKGKLSERFPETFDKKLFRLDDFYHHTLRHTDRLKSRQVKLALEELGLDMSTESRQQVWRLRYFVEQYDFVRTAVSGTISQLEGMACSVDKFSNLLNFYLNLEVDVRRGATEMPFVSSPITEQNSWAFVEEGALKLWMKYLDSFPFLKAGQPDVFADAYQKLDAYYKTSA